MNVLLFAAEEEAPTEPSLSKEQLAEKHRDTREKVISELYSTEADYCACLDLCFNTFFASPSPRVSALSADDMDTLFGQVEDVKTLSRQLIDRLKTDVVGKPFAQQIVGECIRFCVVIRPFNFMCFLVITCVKFPGKESDSSGAILVGCPSLRHQ